MFEFFLFILIFVYFVGLVILILVHLYIVGHVGGYLQILSKLLKLYEWKNFQYAYE